MSSDVIHLSTGDKIGFAVSAILHLLVAVWLMNGFGSASSSPLGYQRKGDPTLIEIGLGPQGARLNPQSSRKKEKVSFHDKDAVLVKPQSIAEKARDERVNESLKKNISGGVNPGRFGLRDGTATEGPMGSVHGRRVSARDRYLYELKILLDGRKVYPQMARQRGESGKVIVRFQVLPDGKIEAVEVTGPSQFNRLNQAALDLVKGVRHYKPFSESIGTQALTLEVPIEYVLN